MMRNGEGGLDAASQRLLQAVERLEARLQTAQGAAPANDDERDRLAGALQESRERERALEAAAAEASAALGRAAEQIRSAIEDEEA